MLADKIHANFRPTDLRGLVDHVVLLTAIAAGEPDHDPFEALDGLRRSHIRGIADAAAPALCVNDGAAESKLRSGGEAVGFRDRRKRDPRERIPLAAE